MEDIKKNRRKFLNCFRPVQNYNCNGRYDCNTNRKCRSIWNKSFRKLNHVNSSYNEREKGWQEKYKERRKNSLSDMLQNNFPLYQKSNKTGLRSDSKDVYAWSDHFKEKSRRYNFSDLPDKLLKEEIRTKSIQENENQCLSEIDHGQIDNLVQEDAKQPFKQVTDELLNESISEPKGDRNFIGKIEYKKSGKVNNIELQKVQIINAELLNKAQISLTTAANKSKYIPSITSGHSVCIRNNEKKIQQNLINELMTMPRENLKKIISDPKSHPKFEIGMEQLVNESRLLLAQKFRNLAESKMYYQGQILQSQLVNDIGNLIDPDLAVDICHLPSEFIKQIGDIFQLDFEENLPMNDYENNNKTSEKARTEKQNMEYYENGNSNIELLLKNRLGENAEASAFNESNTLSSANSDLLQNQNHVDSQCEKFLEWNSHKTNFNEIYIKAEPHSESDCSDSDKKSGKKRFMGRRNNFISKKKKTESRKNYDFNECSFRDCRKTNNIDDNCSVNNNKSTNNSNLFEKSFELLNRDEKKLNLKFMQLNHENFKEKCQNLDFNFCSKTIDNSSVHDACITYYPLQKELVDDYLFSKSEADYSSQNKNTCSQINQTFSIYEAENDVKLNDEAVNDEDSVEKTKHTFRLHDNKCKGRSAETQTNISLIEVLTQGILSHSDDTEETILKEINEIDDFVHRLNQKKFLLFLKLLGLSNCCSKLNAWRFSLLHSITNGDTELLNKLNKRPESIK